MVYVAGSKMREKGSSLLSENYYINKPNAMVLLFNFTKPHIL